MKHWPLRRRITLWTAAIAAVVGLAFGAGVTWHLYRDGMRDLDSELTSIARQFFANLARQPERPKWDNRPAVRELFPFSRSLYFVQVSEPADRVVFRARTLEPATLPLDPHGRDFYTAPVMDKRMRIGVFRDQGITVRVAVSAYQVEEILEDLLITYALAFPVMVTLVGIAGWWLSGCTLKPVREIASAAERITARRLDQRLPMPEADDEVAHLTAVLNKMIDRLAASFAQATRFTADASHELKTPLTILRGEIEAALRAGTFNPEQERLLINLLEETGRLRAITDGLLLLSRADAGRLHLDNAEVDLSALIAELIDDVEILAAPKEISVQADLTPAVRVMGNAQFLRQLLLNLCENAIKYNVPGGSLRVRLARENAHCCITVANTSRGISAKDTTHIFDRFYRGETRAEDRCEGHGLGLSICREIARAHGGEVTVEPNPPAGWTEFQVTLPLKKAAGISPAAAEVTAAV